MLKKMVTRYQQGRMFLGFPSFKDMSNNGIYLMDYFLIKHGLKKKEECIAISHDACRLSVVDSRNSGNQNSKKAVKEEKEDELSLELKEIENDSKKLLSSEKDKLNREIMGLRVMGVSIPQIMRQYSLSKRKAGLIVEKASIIFYRKVFAYLDLGGMSSSEIGKLMGVQQQSISSVISMRSKLDLDKKAS